MRPVLLIDFGSTFTKVTAVDLSSEEIIGTSSAFTTADSDIGTGLEAALDQLRRAVGELAFEYKLACSSAAGGLRMMVSGLVPELTAEAARLAALGAGARITRVFTHELTRRDLRAIEADPPDIFLMTGGTDGGNRSCMEGNAEKLRSVSPRFPVILAGNRQAADSCEDSLQDFKVIVCPNVMPVFGTLNIEPVQREIRALFLNHIINARGLSRASELLSGILMPTPSAILSAMKLLADGTEREPGIGELMGVDVGGATTDVYSVAAGEPSDINVICKGLNEPYAKRTVEGDIGMRYSASGIVADIGEKWIAQCAGLSESRCEALMDELAADKSKVPSCGQDVLSQFDFALASGAVDIATRRHAGTLEEAYTTSGRVYVQMGKDLSRIRRIVFTGGSLIHAADTLGIARHALFSGRYPMSLRPMKASILRDDRYILSAMGVLAEREKEIALRIIKRELVNLGEIGSDDSL
ncbi:MAG TPA: methylaspartate mutase accessory protein GlmL [Bacillota bacterium]|nr:methylaspartate mutase accessory protein GlmL [Bacillota bacterium]